MGTFVHMEGLRGVNLDLITDWEYREKPLPLSKIDDKQTSRPRGALMRLTFAAGHVVELDGEAADALHRHFCTVGRSLT